MQSADLQLMQESATEASQFLRNIANEKRLLTLCRLMEGECSVGSLADGVGLSPSALSQHLNRLRQDGLVDTRRDGQTIYYRLADSRVEALIRLLYDQFCKANC